MSAVRRCAVTVTRYHTVAQVGLCTLWRCDGARCDGARCDGATRHHTVAGGNPSVLGLLEHVRTRKFGCRAASAPQPAQVAKTANSQWAAANETS